MKHGLTDRLRDYAQTVFGLSFALSEANHVEVPFYLRERYFFHHAEILGRPFLIFGPREGESVSPGTIRKDGERLRELLRQVPIWVCPRIDAYERRKLIESRVPFIVPGTQAYLPDLLIDVREHFQDERAQRPAGRLSPSAQRILLHAIYHRSREIDGLMSLDSPVKYSLMTLSRAIGELQDAGLVETEQQGRNKWARFTLPWPEVWAKALPCLRTPVKKRLYIDREDVLRRGDLPRAGLSALTDYSMLNPPRRPVYATVNKFSAAGKSSSEGGVMWSRHVVKHKEESEAELELWSYAPLIEPNAPGCVDRLSLYLSLQDDSDERTQEALRGLLKETLYA